MIVKEKKVFYCEHCRKHRLSRNAMEIHEDICTLNPNRRCRWKSAVWHDNKHPVVDLSRLVKHLQSVAKHGRGRAQENLEPEDIIWLRGEVEGCPACMLAALRQSGLEYHAGGPTGLLWDYGKEVERFRKDEREAEDYADFRNIEAGWA